MIERLRLNWMESPKDLLWWVLSWIVIDVLVAILTLSVADVGRVVLTLLLVYHLLNKGKIANRLTALFSLAAAGFSLWNASFAPLILIPLGIYWLGFAVYLVFSPKHKAWINSISANSST